MTGFKQKRAEARNSVSPGFSSFINQLQSTAIELQFNKIMLQASQNTNIA